MFFLFKDFQPQNIIILFLFPITYCCLLMAIITLDVALYENGWFNAYIMEYLLNTKDIRLSRSIKLYTQIEHPVTSLKICVTVSSHSFVDKYLNKVDNRYFNFFCFWTSQPQVLLNLLLFLLPISVSFFFQSLLWKNINLLF